MSSNFDNPDCESIEFPHENTIISIIRAGDKFFYTVEVFPENDEHRFDTPEAAEAAAKEIVRKLREGKE